MSNQENKPIVDEFKKVVSEKKIEKLTPAQEALMPVYIDKWIKIGTDTNQVDEDTAKSIVRDFRELIKLTPEVPFMFAENPIEAWVLCCLHEQSVPFEKLQETMKSVFAGNRDYTIPKASLPFNDISLCSTFSFYDYMINVVGVELPKDLEAKYYVWQRTSALWGIYPLETLTVVCKKPLEVHLNEEKVLHRDGGPALVFGGEGDFKVYALNGVSVPEYLVVTPSHQIDINLYNKEQNADVKAEFVRKVGIESFLKLGKKLDSFENYDQEENSWWWKSEYELWDMKKLFPSLESAPFLKMVNQTTKIFHMEGVPPECKDLKAAIKSRFGGREMRIVNVA
jgi:hypothetical protein